MRAHTPGYQQKRTAKIKINWLLPDLPLAVCFICALCTSQCTLQKCANGSLCAVQICSTVYLHHDLACMAFTHHKLCDFLFRCSEKMIHRRKYFSFQRGGFFVRRFQYNKNMYDSMCEWWWWWGRSFRNDPHAVFAFDRNSLLNIRTNILYHKKIRIIYPKTKKKKQNKKLRFPCYCPGRCFLIGKIGSNRWPFAASINFYFINDNQSTTHATPQPNGERTCLWNRLQIDPNELRFN